MHDARGAAPGWIVGLALVMVVSTAPRLHAMAGETPLEALTAVARADFASAAAVFRCRGGLSAAKSEEVQSAHARWRKRYRVSEVTDLPNGVVTPELREDLRAETEARLTDLTIRLRIEALCAAYVAAWQGSALDMRRHHPAAFDSSGRPISLEAAQQAHQRARAFAHLTTPLPELLMPRAVGMRARRPDGVIVRVEVDGGPPQPMRPLMPVYSVAQVRTILAEWRLTGQRTSESRIYVRARVAQRGFELVLEDDDATHRVREALPWRSWDTRDVGREVVVGAVLVGEVDRAHLDHTYPVDDVSGLMASAFPVERAVLEARKSAVTTTAGRGVEPGQLVTVLHHAHVQDGRDVEDVYVLLRDGWAYRRATIAPYDLNVPMSRKHEPDEWTRWRSTGSAQYSLPGTPVSGWPSGKRLDGTFRTNPLLPVRRAPVWITFSLDGRFTSRRYYLHSRLRHEAVPFSGSAKRVDSASLSSLERGVVTGLNDKHYGRSASDANHHFDGRSGTYHLEGYALELRFDDGTYERVLSFPVGGADDSMFLSSHPFER